LSDFATAVHAKLIELIRSRDVTAQRAWVAQLSQEESTLVGEWIGTLYVQMSKTSLAKCRINPTDRTTLEQLADYLDELAAQLDKYIGLPDFRSPLASTSETPTSAHPPSE
jgi:hypothetical protein